MSAVYERSAFDDLFNAQFNAVQTWVKANPGKSVADCATALTVPYEIVYAICVRSGFVVLPSASGELHWNQHPA